MANQVSTTFSINATAALQQLAQYQQQLRNTIQLQTQLGNAGGGQGGGSGSGSGVGIGVGNLVGGISATAAGAAFLKFTSDAIQRTKELERANRLLASSATEAGLAYSKLSAENRRFAESAGLTERAAATTTARIAQLAVNSGDSSLARIRELSRAFADLGAARGIESGQLQDLIGTILSGQDEGLNRLGIADPGKLQAEYARQLGKTTEALTQQEKVQAAVNAVLEKAATFTGAAEARQSSFEGQMARSAAAVERFYDAMGQVITRQPGFSTALEIISRNLPGSTNSTFQQRVADGTVTQADIQAEILRRDQTLIGGPGGRRYGLNSLALLFAYLRGDQQGLAEGSALFFPESRQGLIAGDIQQEINAAILQRGQASEVSGDATVKRFQAEIKAQLDAAQKLREDQRKAALQEEQRLEKLRTQVRSLRDLIAGFAAQDNPFVRIFEDAAKAIQRVIELTQGLGQNVQNAALRAAQTGNFRALLDARFSSAIQSFNLGSSAADFRSGLNLDALSPQQAERRRLRQLQGQLRSIGAFDGAPVMGYLGEDATTQQRKAAEEQYRQAMERFRMEQTARDRQVIQLTEGFNPARLDRQTRELAASARERESTRVSEQERDARALFSNLNKILSADGIRVVLGEGEQVVRIVNEAPGAASVSQRPSQSATNGRYSN